MVEILGKKGGPGVVVSSQGHVVTSPSYLTRGAATVRVKVGTDVLDAKVVLVDPSLALAVLALPPGMEYPSAAVRLDAAPLKGAWVVGIDRGPKGKWIPRLERVKKPAAATRALHEMNFTLSPGCPILDSTGKVLGVMVGKTQNSAHALPMDRLKQELSAVLSAQAGAP